ncbi:uncharacterized protein DEA37_0007522 [Paragonimus westermani]|uniref:Nuclear receptor domain-containing protein n=1 Tax=Paragonimus westermani TaxID=34504 RepID=A0A5J4NUC1_9TREM|nr:uncharacterized protein DEA37_0007522 [Paragonimus westermani]
MLSDLTFNTDFLTNRIMGADSSSNKRDWNDISGLMPEEMTTNFFGSKPNSRSFINADDKISTPVFLDEPSVAQSYPNFVENAINIVDNHVTGDLNLIHSFGVCRPCDCVDNEKFLPGNREELTTPVALAGFDTAAMLEGNYLYGHVNGTARHLIHPRDCYSFGLVASPPLPLPDASQMNNGTLDLQFGHFSTTTTTTTAATSVGQTSEFDFGQATSDDSSPYTLATQLGLRSSPNKDEDLVGSKLASMNCSSSCSSSLLWLDGPDTQRELSSYCTLMDSHDSFLVQHSSSSDCVDQTSGILTTLEPDTSVEELYTTYERMDTSAEEATTCVNNRHSGVTEAMATVSSSATETVETRRDKVTGKYKQTNNSTDHLAGSEKRCKVCGDRAVNHNFGQLTCESCKAFFRRNAHKVCGSQ